MDSGVSGGFGNNQLDQPGSFGDTDPGSDQGNTMSSSRIARLIRILLVIAIVGSLVFITIIVFVFWQNSKPAIDYEALDVGKIFPPQVCPGDQLRFDVLAQIRRAPAILSVVENWTYLGEPRMSYLDPQIEWRIVEEPIRAHFTVLTRVPDELKPGPYSYQRALGLNVPLIITFNTEVKDCHGSH
jgi:hypothetical protein